MSCSRCGRDRGTIAGLCDDCTLEAKGMLFPWLAKPKPVQRVKHRTPGCDDDPPTWEGAICPRCLRSRTYWMTAYRCWTKAKNKIQRWRWWWCYECQQPFGAKTPLAPLTWDKVEGEWIPHP